MAKIIPFNATLPSRDKVHLVASRSYISYSKPHLRGKLASNPFSFLHIINPDFFNPNPTKVPKEKYELVRKKYLDFKAKGYFQQLTQPAFFLYRQIKFDRQYTGIIGGASVMDYLEEHIRIHEHTISKREKMFTDYLNSTGFNAEPVLISHPPSKKLTSLKQKFLKKRPEFDFSTTDYVQHQFWVIENEEEKKLISGEFEKFENLYIADGHHRTASSARLAEMALRNHETGNGKMFFMSMFIDEEELSVLPFHRVVSNISPYNETTFLKEIKNNFDEVEIVSGNYHGPTKQHEIGMFLNGNWFRLKKIVKEDSLDPSRSLDTQILNDIVFQGMLEVKDIKKDKRIKFLGGTHEMEELEELVTKKRNKVAFALYPISIKEIKKVADAQQVMPPKSTWIEPKLRSGLVIYEF